MPVSDASAGTCRPAAGEVAHVARADIAGPRRERHDERQFLGGHAVGEQADLGVPEEGRRTPCGRRPSSRRRPARPRRPPGDQQGATARPTAGPSAILCGRTPRAPASEPVVSPTASWPRPASRSSAQPSGEASAALAAMRLHSAGISFGFCRRLATASVAARPTAPAAAVTVVRRGPPPDPRAAPATAPMPAANRAPCHRARSSAMTARYRRPRPTAGSCSRVAPSPWGSNGSWSTAAGAMRPRAR